MSRFCFICLFSGLFTLLVTERLPAQLHESQRNQLADTIESAAKNLDPDLFPNLDESKSEVLSQIRSVEQFFERKTDAANTEAWMDYLALDDLEEALSSDASARSIKSEAEDVRYRLVGTAPGLELTVLRKLRTAITKSVSYTHLTLPTKA